MVAALVALGVVAGLVSGSPVKRDATYNFQWVGNSSQCLTAATGPTGLGGLLGLSPCEAKNETYSIHQSWIPTEGQPGPFTLGTNTIYCLEYNADPYSPSSAVSLTYCDGGEEQNFNFEGKSIITPSNQCVAVNTTKLTDESTNPQGFPAIQQFLYVKDCAEGDVDQQWAAVDY